MEQAIKDRYNDGILKETLQRYDINPDNIKALDGFESYIYEFERNNEAFILRITHTIRRTVEHIQAEVDWINYLVEGGAGVAKAILSQNQQLVEKIDDGEDGQFLATTFIKAQGKGAWEHPKFNTPEYLQTYGRLLGKIHALSKKYTPTTPNAKRPQWDDVESMDIEKWIPASDTVVTQRYHNLMQYLKALPKDQETYGLIHFDAHLGNFFIDDDLNITLFDFDDCGYSWYINDIAMVAFYSLKGNEDLTETFMTEFLKGYQEETSLDPMWLKEIPHFMKLREIDLYAVIHRSFDMDNLDENPWAANFMNGRKEKIENNVPFIDFDFSNLLP